jgi:hypothetical protein
MFSENGGVFVEDQTIAKMRRIADETPSGIVVSFYNRDLFPMLLSKFAVEKFGIWAAPLH